MRLGDRDDLAPGAADVSDNALVQKHFGSNYRLGQGVTSNGAVTGFFCDDSRPTHERCRGKIFLVVFTHPVIL